MTAGPYSIGSDHWPGVSKLIEEMGELQQVLGKLLGTGGDHHHWDGSDLYVRLMEEAADVTAALEFVLNKNLPDILQKPFEDRIEQKLALFGEWHEAQ